MRNGYHEKRQGQGEEMAAVKELPESGIAEEDLLRAQLYQMLSHFLGNPPSEKDLANLAAMNGDESPLGEAIASLAKIAAKTDVALVAQEYHDLFIGVGRGELLPYGSYYLTGFLHEKPLANLRNDMTRLGIARRETVKIPEDHIAAIFEMMAGLITGKYGTVFDLDEQREFFHTHIGSWASHFMSDLEAAKSSILYASLGTIGRIFLEIEEVAFTME